MRGHGSLESLVLQSVPTAIPLTLSTQRFCYQYRKRMLQLQRANCALCAVAVDLLQPLFARIH